jgi:hypothetical protein
MGDPNGASAAALIARIRALAGQAESLVASSRLAEELTELARLARAHHGGPLAAF